MAAKECGVRFGEFLIGSSENGPSGGRLKLLRKHAHVERRDRSSTHRVDIGQCVSGGDPTKQFGIVNERSDEVDRLHQPGPAVGQIADKEHPGVVTRLGPNEHCLSCSAAETSGPVTR